MKRHLYITSILSLTLLLLGCETSSKTADTEVAVDSLQQSELIEVTQSQFEYGKMQLGPIEQKDFPTTIKASGMIDVPPENRAVVTATRGGYIKQAPLLVGNVVKKGQLLVTLENPEFVTLQQEYMEIHEQLTYLKAEYDRQKTMKAENITSQKSFLKAESAYKTAVAKYKGLDKQLRMLHIAPSQVIAGQITSEARIYAPISGSITQIHITKGSYVSPATSILEIVDNEHIHLELSVFEKDIMAVKKDQQISFKIPEVSEEPYKAEVHLVGTALASNRTVKVHGHIEDEDNHNFLTGMFVDASIITGFKTESALPNDAISDIDNINYVLVLKKQEAEVYYFEQVEVLVGATSDGFSEVTFKKALPDDSLFLLKGAFSLIGE
ncbi:MAG: efflux RND transporter periplasmic adaptor subunit [Algicola sp.]|nr:efflux RND transporter periplasmic adaptor subunit [Algicola sp.]